MASTEVGVGHVRLVPSMRGFSGAAQQQLTAGMMAPAAAAGRQSGQRMGQTATTAAGAALSQSGQRLTSALSGPAAAAGTGFSQTLGGRVSAGAGAAFGSVGAAADRAGTSVRGAASGMGSALSTTLGVSANNASHSIGGIGASFRQMGAVGSAALAAIGITNFTQSVYSMGSSIQDSTAALTGLYGSADTASYTVDSLNESFAASRLGAEVFHDGAVSLGYLGIEGDQAVGMLENMETGVNALKGGPAQIDSITSALSKTQSQGNAFNGELNMISEAGFPIFAELQGHLGKTEDEIKTMASQGQIGLEDLLAVLENPTSDAFGNAVAAAEELEQTFASSFQAAKGEVITALGEMMVPLLDKFAPGVESIGQHIQSGLGALPGLLSSVGETMERYGITDALSRFASGIQDVAVGAVPLLKGLAIGLAGAFGAVLLVLGPLGDHLATLGGLMQEHQGIVQTLGTIVGVWLGARWAAMGAAAVLNAGRAAGAFLSTQAAALRAMGAHIRTFAVMTAQWVATAARAVASAGRIVAAWMMTAAGAARAAAVQVGQFALVVAGWVRMGAQALIQGARMAAAWVLGMGPIGWVIAAIVGLVALVAIYWDEIVGFITTAWEWIQAVSMQVWNAIWGFLTGVWDSIVETAIGVWDWLVDIVSGALDWLLDLFMSWHPLGIIISHWDSIVAAFQAGIDWARNIVDAGIQAVLGFLGNLAQIPGMVGGFFSNMVSTAAGWISTFLGNVRAIPGNVLSALGNMSRLLVNAGKNVITGLINGLRSMLSNLRSTVSNVASTIRNFLPFSPAKTGPLSGSGSPDRAGEVIGDMVADGMRASIGGVSMAGASLAGAALPSGMGAVRGGDGAAVQDLAVTIDGAGMPRALEQWLRKSVRVTGGGSAQQAFGRR